MIKQSARGVKCTKGIGHGEGGNRDGVGRKTCYLSKEESKNTVQGGGLGAARLVTAGDLLLLTQLEVLGALQAQLLLGLALLALQPQHDLLGGLSLRGAWRGQQGHQKGWEGATGVSGCHRANGYGQGMGTQTEGEGTHSLHAHQTHTDPKYTLIGTQCLPSCGRWAWSDHRNPAACGRIFACPAVNSAVRNSEPLARKQIRIPGQSWKLCQPCTG